MVKSLRDYGLPDPDEVLGTPTWDGSELPCPNCGAKLCHVSVAVAMKSLRGGRGVSSYLGCPACPYASPALMVSDAARKEGE